MRWVRHADYVYFTFGRLPFDFGPHVVLDIPRLTLAIEFLLQVLASELPDDLPERLAGGVVQN